MLQSSVAASQGSKFVLALCVGGVCSVFAVNQSDDSQSWASARSRMQKRTDSVFLRVCYSAASLWSVAWLFRKPKSTRKKSRAFLTPRRFVIVGHRLDSGHVQRAKKKKTTQETEYTPGLCVILSCKKKIQDAALAHYAWRVKQKSFVWLWGNSSLRWLGSHECDANIWSWVLTQVPKDRATVDLPRDWI